MRKGPRVARTLKTTGPRRLGGEPRRPAPEGATARRFLATGIAYLRTARCESMSQHQQLSAWGFLRNGMCANGVVVCLLNDAVFIHCEHGDTAPTCQTDDKLRL
jgi:hypothetical protein